MTALADLVHPGALVALADGTGSPRSLTPELSELARRRGDLRLLTGWLPAADPGLDPGAFADARTIMPGWGLRRHVDAGALRVLPVRISAVPALLAGRLRPDLLVATLVRRPDGLRFPTEVAWMRGLVESGVPVAAVVSRTAPCADAGDPLPDAAITVVAENDDRPAEIAVPEPGPVETAIAAHVAALVPEGARVQVAPGRLGSAVLAALQVPVRVDSGLLPESVVDLDERGLLLDATAAYLVGTRRLYDWADGRPLLGPVETVHDPTRLAAAQPPLVAVNTALEIDPDGQVNVEGTATSAMGGIGGHPDYAMAGSRCPGGLSVIALAATHGGRPTLVERLSRPVTTAGHDVDVVVTERGVADLRGLDRTERRHALAALWG
ncbi:acetyl-CoA hydrolase/transferase C-terminal domain-containing protein [Pseudonocardia sp. CA-107938]|uniref:acetyl-CoA hydrolase/transferase C-terminal domain-containing protein n=1 Tax=Pseudonocardia sp. CA-107938 TaxID=3240021 RepID=UPI003D8D6201